MKDFFNKKYVCSENYAIIFSRQFKRYLLIFYCNSIAMRIVKKKTTHILFQNDVNPACFQINFYSQSIFSLCNVKMIFYIICLFRLIVSMKSQRKVCTMTSFLNIHLRVACYDKKKLRYSNFKLGS